MNENIAPACGIDTSVTRVQFMYDAINASSLTLVCSHVALMIEYERF